MVGGAIAGIITGAVIGRFNVYYRLNKANSFGADGNPEYKKHTIAEMPTITKVILLAAFLMFCFVMIFSVMAMSGKYKSRQEANYNNNEELEESYDENDTEYLKEKDASEDISEYDDVANETEDTSADIEEAPIVKDPVEDEGFILAQTGELSINIKYEDSEFATAAGLSEVDYYIEGSDIVDVEGIIEEGNEASDCFSNPVHTYKIINYGEKYYNLYNIGEDITLYIPGSDFEYIRISPKVSMDNKPSFNFDTLGYVALIPTELDNESYRVEYSFAQSDAVIAIRGLNSYNKTYVKDGYLYFEQNKENAVQIITISGTAGNGEKIEKEIEAFNHTYKIDINTGHVSKVEEEE